ncbi:hypothetical protein [Bradyrhizobium macuxiense]|uniref:hypothetical protein n=1 Tax=Bradyrhizobium macuxiense TaxID=1755647 RepID=UPI000A852D40|nr:hypothetical protein [Bradyrhizobium macuxiense]
MTYPEVSALRGSTSPNRAARDLHLQASPDFPEAMLPDPSAASGNFQIRNAPSAGFVRDQ